MGSSGIPVCVNHALEFTVPYLKKKVQPEFEKHDSVAQRRNIVGKTHYYHHILNPEQWGPWELEY